MISMQNYYDVIICGGGAAGLSCACAYALSAKGTVSLAVLEAGERVGRKIAMSGGGKCNLSNVNLTEKAYNDVDFAEKHLLSNAEILGFFLKIGLLTRKQDGLIYPASEISNSVVDALRYTAEKKGVRLLTGKTVEGVKNEDGFTLQCGEEAYKCRKLVYACGSNASGGRNSLYLLPKGVPIVPFSPALAPIKCETAMLKGLSGVRQKCRATLTENGKPVITLEGEILFKDFGLSGILALQLSRYYKDNSKCKVLLNLLPQLDAQQLRALLRERIINGMCTTDNAHIGLLHKAFFANIFTALGIITLTTAQIEPLAALLEAYPIEVKGLGDYSQAQICRGGVSIKGINDKYEFINCPNAYCIGEMLNVDGDTGGYNLALCWSEGIKLGERLAKEA